MKHRVRLSLALALPLALTWLTVAALPVTAAEPNGAEQQEVERRLVQLQQAISELQQRLESAQTRQREEQAALRELDLAMQAISQRLRALSRQQQEHLDKLAGLEQQRDQQLHALRLQQDQLAAQINGTYRLSRQSRIKLVLNQDDTTRLSRLLGYYEHINNAQAQKIIALRTLLAELERVYDAIDAELTAVGQVRTEQEQALQRQQEQRSERQQLLLELAAQITTEEAELVELRHNQKNLETLLEKLSDVLADIPAGLGQHLKVADQKGRLPLPVQGRVLHAFGKGRAGGINWQGWVLDAEPGTEVSSIAYGRVAFADWFRGYGLLMIIDHGEGFMSLYGYNESLLWEAGDWVEPGTVLATVGTSPAGDRGLYFELRKNGRALDPAAWLSR